MNSLEKQTRQFNTSYKFPQEILRDKSLTPADKIVAFHLFRFINDLGTSGMPKVETISSDLNITKRTVIRAKAKLISKGYLSINEDNTYNFQIAGITYTTKDLKKKDTMNMLGNFIKVPLFMLYIHELTSAEKLYLMMFFDYFFEVVYENRKISFRHKRDVKLTDLHNLYKDYAAYDAFKKALQSIKAKTDWLDWKAMINTNKDGEIRNAIYGAFIPKARVCIVPETEIMQKKEQEYTKNEEVEEATYSETEEPVIEVNEATIPERLKMKYKNSISNWPAKDIMSWCNRNGVEYTVIGENTK